MEGRRPVFKYTAGETVIEDYVIPEAGALPAFTRQLTLTGSGQYYYLAAADGFIEKRGDSWKVGKNLKLTLDSPDAPILRDGANEGTAGACDCAGKAILRAKYEWDLN